MKKDDPCIRINVPVQEMVAISLHKLGSGDGLQSIRNLYEVHKRILSKKIKDFYRVVRKQLQLDIMQTPSESQFEISFKV